MWRQKLNQDFGNYAASIFMAEELVRGDKIVTVPLYMLKIAVVVSSETSVDF
jgi:hypothetical protein